MLAKAAGQLASMLNMPPSSQASPLPHRVVAEHSLCNSPDPLWEQSLLAMKSTRFQTKTSHPNRRQTPLLQNLPTHLHQATHPCAFAYNYARIRPLVRLVSGFYCLSCHCPSVVGFSSPGNTRRLHRSHQSGICLHSMVAVRMAPSGAPGFVYFTGLLTCAQLPPFRLVARRLRPY